MSESQPAKKSTPTSVRRPVSGSPTSVRRPLRAKMGKAGKAGKAGATGSGGGASPVWYAPVMLGLMLLGLAWIVVFYMTAGSFPVAAWGNWNMGAGFVLIITGFLMTTNWR
ncbi:MAG: cell division protein CrgA [Dermatophilaceae bacterium]